MFKRWITVLLCAVAAFLIFTAESCDNSSDSIQQEQQEQLLAEGTAATGMPAIKNFRERKIMKDIQELRDQEGLVTYTYLYSEMTATMVYLGESIGYPIPYATQYTNPMKVYRAGSGITIPQADPNGLFSPSSAEGTWILLKNPRGSEVRPVYIEPRVLSFPFKWPASSHCIYPTGQ